jgi:hypothetical protein
VERTVDITEWTEDDDRTDAAFEEGWQAEQDTRTELIKQVELLADMHPPRTSWRR